MQVIGHHGKGADVDGEDGGQQFQSLHDPGFSVVEVFAAIAILAAQKGSAHAA